MLKMWRYMVYTRANSSFASFNQSVLTLKLETLLWFRSNVIVPTTNFLASREFCEFARVIGVLYWFVMMEWGAYASVTECLLWRDVFSNCPHKDFSCFYCYPSSERYKSVANTFVHEDSDVWSQIVSFAITSYLYGVMLSTSTCNAWCRPIAVMYIIA